MPTTTWARHGLERFLRTSLRGIFQTSPHCDARPVAASERNTLPACANQKTTKTALNQCRPTTGSVIGEIKETAVQTAMTRIAAITENHSSMPAYAGREHDTMLPLPQETANKPPISGNLPPTTRKSTQTKQVQTLERNGKNCPQFPPEIMTSRLPLPMEC